ncbi:hypothetical protein LZ495_43375 [Yinghuangia sp. KLBMP8922]|uniref:Uncharacterized protein n=2 Tax=Yinghuangia soli TaxID=2908204 RepID=A0AA41U7G7_9ACTN|nr:hypothetical protein [Yinghuangia soli]MCF2534032.1 hypothetical protein [Yinghuangia soli]
MRQFFPQPTDVDGCPPASEDGWTAIWLEAETGDVIIQAHEASKETIQMAQEVGSIPGHSTDVPEHEVVVRLAAAMRQFLPQASEVTSDVSGT